MEVVGLMMVRNEVDILRVNVLHHLAQGIDRFLIIDNGSTDGTDNVLQELARGGRVHWIRDDGPYRQAERTTELAREAWRKGADWVVPIDADEFWYAPHGGFRRVLAQSNAGAIEVQLVNYIQRRDQLNPSPYSLLQMTRRTPQTIGPVTRAAELIETCQIAFVEHAYAPKWISRPSSDVAIHMGNHSVAGVAGPATRTEQIVCLHAPLRARAFVEARMVEHRRRAPDWNARRAGRLAETLGVERAIEREWAANSYADDCLDVYGVRHPVVFDPRLRDALRPWVTGGRPEYTQVDLKEPSALAVASPELVTRPEEARLSILARMNAIEGWLYEAEASLLMTTVVLALSECQPHAVVEIGSYCGRSTVVLGSVMRAIYPAGKVYAIDPHEGELTLPVEGLRVDAPTLEQFRHNIAEAGLTDVVQSIEKRSFEVAWERPISLLFIDGLHDYESVSRDFAHFEPWVVDGGYVVFDDYDHQAFSGVVACVREVLDSGRYRRFRRVGRMMVVQKDSSATRDGGGAPSDCESRNPNTMAVRAIFAETVGPLQAALDERTAWGEQMEQEATRRSAVIDELHRALTERTAWAERMVAEAETRGEIIDQLQQALTERAAWAERMAAEAEARGRIIDQLQQTVSDKTIQIERLAAEIEHSGEVDKKTPASPTQRLRGVLARIHHSRSQRG
jgi:hypothetical protein